MDKICWWSTRELIMGTSLITKTVSRCHVAQFYVMFQNQARNFQFRFIFPTRPDRLITKTHWGWWVNIVIRLSIHVLSLRLPPLQSDLVTLFYLINAIVSLHSISGTGNCKEGWHIFQNKSQVDNKTNWHFHGHQFRWHAMMPFQRPSLGECWEIERENSQWFTFEDD